MSRHFGESAAVEGVMRRSGVYLAVILLAGLMAGGMVSPATAQVPVPGAPDCVCLRIAVDALGADLAAKRQAYDGMQNEIGQIDNQMQAERSRMDVNSPEAVARFRQLLERRDALFRQSSGPVFGELSAATDRYGARVQEYNARCAGRPMDPGLLAQAQATRACPPPY
jgi:fructose-1,6-bisphosphatase/sedoheptulose 1,7-bisphosphatase-like protein